MSFLKPTGSSELKRKSLFHVPSFLHPLVQMQTISTFAISTFPLWTLLCLVLQLLIVLSDPSFKKLLAMLGIEPMALSSTFELQPSPVSYLALPFLKANIMSLSAFFVSYSKNLYVAPGLI